MTIQTTQQDISSKKLSLTGTPPLNTGDRLSRVEFEHRYQAHPEIKKAELIEGVVYMPSPVRFNQHAKPYALIIAWLGLACMSLLLQE